MKQKLTFTFFAVIMGLAAPFASTSGAMAQQAKDAKIIIVDVQEIYRTSLAGKDLLSQIETHRAELEAEAARYQQDARDEQTELERQQAILSPEAFEEKRRSIGQKYTSIQTDLRDKARRLQIAQSKADRELQIETEGDLGEGGAAPLCRAAVPTPARERACAWGGRRRAP